GKAGGTAFRLTVSGNGSPAAVDKAPIKIDFSGDNSDAGALIALYGLPSLPLGNVGDGHTSLTASGTLAGGLTSSLDFEGQDMQASFDGTLQVADGLAAIKGATHLEAADIEPWLMTTGL